VALAKPFTFIAVYAQVFAIKPVFKAEGISGALPH
jgi:hypothetical protein